MALDCKLTIGLRPFDIAVVESQNPEAQHRLPTLINDKTPLAWFTAETNLRAVFRRNQQQNRANKITRQEAFRVALIAAFAPFFNRAMYGRTVVAKQVGSD